MPTLQFPKFTSRVTVLCDCTTKALLLRGGVLPAKGLNHYKILNCSQVSARDAVNEYFSQEFVEGKNYVVTISHPAALLAVAVILANSVQEFKLDEVPHLAPNAISVYEIWDDEYIKVSKEDGSIPTSSFDVANQPIIADWMNLQKLNAPKSEPERIEICETKDAIHEGETPTKTVEQIIQERNALKAEDLEVSQSDD